MNFIKFVSALGLSLALLGCGGGGGSAGTSLGGTTTEAPATALFSSAPPAVTVANGASQTFTVGGGTAPYAASSSNLSVTSAAISGSTLTINGVATGVAQVVVVDAVGASLSISVSAGTGDAVANFYITAPSAVTLAPGSASTYAIGGGTAPYTVSSSNTSIAMVAVSGTTLTIGGVATGTAQITVFDATGKSLGTTATVSTGAAPTMLYMNAASAITVTPGSVSAFLVGGGTAPYTVSSSNASVGTATVTGTTLTINGVLAGTAQVTVFDSSGASVSTSVTVSSSVAATALYINAASTITIAPGVNSSYAIGGGTAPYSVSSNNASVATASVSGTTLTISGVTAGSAQIVVFDSAGKSVNTVVTVSTGVAPTALYTTAQSTVTIVVGASQSYSVGGGTAPYMVSSGNTSVAAVTVSGTSLTITGVAPGTAQISVFDLLGNSVSLNVTVGTGSTAPLYMTAPSAITVAPSATSTYLIGGGASPYSVSTSNNRVATAAVAGTTLTVNGVGTGTAQIMVFDATGKSVATLATVSSGAAATTLYVTAPSAVTVAVGASPTYTIGGGTGPYIGSSGNIGIATASITGTTLTITGVAAGSTEIKVFDATGAAVTVIATVGTGSTATLYMTAPSTITSAPGAAAIFVVGGGTAPYNVSSSNPAVATVGLSGTSLTITGVSSGTAQISVFDATGKSVATSVSVGSGAATALFTTAPGSLTVAVGATPVYAITGGTPPYAVSSSNPAIASAVVNPDGKSLTITGIAAGTSQIDVLDAVGASVKTSLTVGGSGAALATTAPSSITVAIGANPSYTISGGTAPYTATSSNTGIATTVGSAGTTLTVNGVATGSATVVVRDAVNATVSLTVNVGPINALYTTAPSAVMVTVGTAPTYTISGGVAPYAVSSSNTGVSVATLVGGNTLSIPGTTLGTAQVVVFDATGKSVTINVTVVSAGSTTPLYTTAPASVTIGTAGTGTYTIGGGTAAYTATTSNASVATASVIGNSLTINGLAGGTATVIVRDAANTTVSIAVTVGSANALFTNAPSVLTIARLAAPTYTIGGGSAPYSASSANVSIATASVSGTTLTITGVAAGGTSISVLDSTGKAVAIDLTVSSGSPGALFTTAPDAITIATGATPTYAISGGTAPYTATSSNASFATTTGSSGNVLQINGISAGFVSVVVSDAVGTSKTIAVTVTPIATTPLTVLPSAVTANVGDVLNFRVSGGSPAYSITANNVSIATVSVASVAASGGTFTATLRNVGTTTVAVVDALGQTTTLTLTVAAPSTLLRLSPSALMVGEDYKGSIVLSIYGGTAPYVAYTSDLGLSTVTTAGATLTDTGGVSGNRCINPVDAALVYIPTGTFDVTLTVVDSLGASATSIITIKDNGKGGAGC